MRNLNSGDHLEELQKLKQGLRPHVRMWHGVSDTTQKRFATVEICTKEISLRVIFTFTPPETNCFFLDDFQLEIRPDEEAILALSLVAPPTSLESLHDNLLHRLHLNLSLNSSSSVQLALGRYWAHLTSGGPVFESDELERLLIAALIHLNENPSTTMTNGFTMGQQYLSKEGEALLAYRFNAVYFLNRHLTPIPPDLKNITATTALGKLLSTPDFDFFQLTTVLQIVGFLQASLEKQPLEAPKCRKVMGMPRLDISWKQDSTLHIVMPLDFEKALEHLAFCMKQNEQACLACFSEALEVFLPSFQPLPIKNPPERLIYGSTRSIERCARTNSFLKRRFGSSFFCMGPDCTL